MRKILTTALGLSLIAAATMQMASAAERHRHVRHIVHTQTNQQFRDAHDSLDWPLGNNTSRLYNEGNS
jgi:hypothetical protein